MTSPSFNITGYLIAKKCYEEGKSTRLLIESLERASRIEAAAQAALVILEEEDIAEQDVAERVYCILVKVLEEMRYLIREEANRRGITIQLEDQLKEE